MTLTGVLRHGTSYLAGQLGLSRDEQEVVLYGLELAANLFLTSVLLLSLGLYLGTFWTTIFAAMPAASVRSYAGGHHCSCQRNCILTSTITYGFAGWLARSLGPSLPPALAALVLPPALATAAYAAWRYAPVDTPQKPLRSPARRARARRRAFIGLTAWTALIAALAIAGLTWTSNTPERASFLLSLAYAGTLGLLLQSVTLCPWGGRALAAWDALWNAVFTHFAGRKEG